MEIKKMLVPESRYSVLCPYEMNPTEITFHNTYNDAPAINERNNVANNSTGTSFHVAVDDKEAIQLIPYNRNAWHAGDGANGRGNRHSIGVEICYSLSGGDRYRKAELNAIKVIRQLMNQFNIPIERVKTHQERNGKYCPHRMLDEGRVSWFKSQLTQASQKEDKGVEIIVNKFNKVVTYEFGVNLIPDMVQMMDQLGFTTKIVSRGDRQGLVYFETDYRQGNELDKATAWLDAKGLKYYYTKE
ncbi:N-acetylmuramoyl-L-alanine amidase C-terminal domain-containing protein [Bacillus thuringiensis]|uniref:N-acetylmuramoyl-L-alanine amidase n=1 Tax=Bacillus thuringiensis TaxID=1428 RepID=UPI002DBD018C|nr:N-acetylmuramoyl-L-alanine amidase [Bacillus thuringiensis]MEC3222339.1 N-acetylmuramoyl-L-alanine amidase C-terminal domain-containing protein [Bacillus thuringiensis]MEC3553890.1 N-acetylmuramoyl-L-alanine amidase C-terminal domain-containing protein [Bacillus thuringiensis]MED1831799.1 N-acetylmuramoyl-L-alanine amidase C-terminal domain-containing protein [Bacillus thuringiensis]MED2058344.1 N-acetylmuramoyl-L-alanine amidase C-terminal domain-containing protein [Bacillus thuringiensis]